MARAVNLAGRAFGGGDGGRNSAQHGLGGAYCLPLRFHGAASCFRCDICWRGRAAAPHCAPSAHHRLRPCLALKLNAFWWHTVAPSHGNHTGQTPLTTGI